MKSIFTLSILLMRKIFLCTLCLVLYTNFFSFSQPAEYKMTRSEYAEKYKDIAIKKMLEYKIPASITLAQGMLESDNGNSALAVYGNNHFGIKCHQDWEGDTYHQDDDKKDECFRKYKSVEESFEDHSVFLTTKSRYAFLFELKPTDYKGWADGLQEAGYATSRQYASALIKIIEDNKLYQYDRMAILPIDKKSTGKVQKQQIVKHEFKRIIFLNNQVKCIVAQEGDTYYKIARELDMRLWQLHKYNETGQQTCLQPGDMVYLQPKRKQSRKEEFHTARFADTMYGISQQYGIKIRHLYKMNNMHEGQEPQAGQKILLKRKRNNFFFQILSLSGRQYLLGKVS